MESQANVGSEEQTVDNTHLLFEISQETYDVLQEFVERAESRGLNTDATYWLESMACKHMKVQNDLWDRADDAATLKRAQNGNRQSIRTVLSTLGIKDENAVDALLKSIAKK